MKISAEAAHEGSHYICGALNSARIRYVAIGSGYGSETRMAHEGLYKDSIDTAHVLTRDVTMILLAGVAGEQKYTGKLNLQGGGGDFKQLMLTLMTKGHSDIENWPYERIWREYSSDAIAFVSHPLRWKMILKFAEELQAKRKISGSDALRFLQREAKKMSMKDQLEFWFPQDNLGGSILPLEQHGN